MTPQEKLQDLESRNIRLQAAHNQDQELLQKALASLQKAQLTVDTYQKYCSHLSNLLQETMDDWGKTIDMLTQQLLIGILCGILLLISVQNLAEIFLK